MVVPAMEQRLRAYFAGRGDVALAYLEVDPRQVHQVLHDHLDDFLTFARHIAEYLERTRPKG